jgi:hypothetical protein
MKLDQLNYKTLKINYEPYIEKIFTKTSHIIVIIIIDISIMKK